MRVEVRPANFGYTDSTGKKTTTLVAVYAPVDVKYEVRGICSQLAHDTADKAGLGLANSQFHTMQSFHSKTSTRDYILSSHMKIISKYSTCTISADTYELDKYVSSQLCRELLPSSFASVTDIQSRRDLLLRYMRRSVHYVA